MHLEPANLLQVGSCDLSVMLVMFDLLQVGTYNASQCTHFKPAYLLFKVLVLPPIVTS